MKSPTIFSSREEFQFHPRAELGVRPCRNLMGGVLNCKHARTLGFVLGLTCEVAESAIVTTTPVPCLLQLA
jgi:hypothetical protein